MDKYITLEKAVGETPLACLEAYRAAHPELSDVPMAYAGRLDPMASGKLLVLLGDECKQQTAYHGLDKAYDFSVLFGIGSDTQDVLGQLTPCDAPSRIDKAALVSAAAAHTGTLHLPYPTFSAKTVQGKPLHTWTLEGRLDEITIPTNTSTVYELSVTNIATESRAHIAAAARTKIDTIPPVTDERKTLGNDFRRHTVRRDWETIRTDEKLPQEYTIADFRCVASSGTYMRALAASIAQTLGTCGLAWRIHRTHIGVYDERTGSWETAYD